MQLQILWEFQVIKIIHIKFSLIYHWQNLPYSISDYWNNHQLSFTGWVMTTIIRRTYEHHTHKHKKVKPDRRLKEKSRLADFLKLCAIKTYMVRVVLICWCYCQCTVWVSARDSSEKLKIRRRGRPSCFGALPNWKTLDCRPTSRLPVAVYCSWGVFVGDLRNFQVHCVRNVVRPR